ncbi:MAG: LysR family transcriptional regulator, partial [Burkholderiaceae bacterium]
MNDTTHRGWSRALRQLDLNLLRVFDAVLQHRNLTRAAEQLAMTQPAVSNAVRRLRDALQDDVIRRHGQGVLPTPKALRLWPVVRGCLAQLDAALDEGAFAP